MNRIPGWMILGVGLVTIATNAPIQAATYYVSPKGDDNQAGSKSAPFQTIQKAATQLQPGDVCEILPGVYRETVIPLHSGEKGHPIVFRAKKANTVIISGTEPIGPWHPIDHDIYEAAVDGPITQVFADGQMLEQARWPNAEPGVFTAHYAKATKGSSTGRIVDTTLPTCDLTGATLHIVPGSHWVSWTRPVLSHNTENHTITFNADWGPEPAYAVKEGTWYYLFGAPAFLDAPGEWHYDATKKTLRVILPHRGDPNRARMEIRRRDLAIDLKDRQHIVLKGLNIFSSTLRLANAKSCQIEGCHIRYASHFTDCEGWQVRMDTGLILGGSDNIVRNSSIQYSSGNGISLTGENNTIENCLIAYVDQEGTDCGAIFADGRGHVIRRSTLHDAGRSLLLHRTLKAGHIEYNHLYRAGLLTDDLGITYCFDTDGEGTEIAHNWVHDNLAKDCGVGIYIDNNSSNFIIHHNVSWGNGNSGIRLNTPSHNNLVYNNTVLANGDSLSFWGADNNRDQTGCRVINNIFTDKVMTGDGLLMKNNFEGKDPRLRAPATQDYRPQKDSPCIDAGTPVDHPSTQPFKGHAPDLGAYESGTSFRKPGHTWKKAPDFRTVPL